MATQVISKTEEAKNIANVLEFEGNESQWEHFRRDKDGFIQWAEQKKGNQRIVYPFVTGTGMAMVAGETVPEGQKKAVKKQDKLVVNL